VGTPSNQTYAHTAANKSQNKESGRHGCYPWGCSRLTNAQQLGTKLPLPPTAPSSQPPMRAVLWLSLQGCVAAILPLTFASRHRLPGCLGTHACTASSHSTEWQAGWVGPQGTATVSVPASTVGNGRAGLEPTVPRPPLTPHRRPTPWVVVVARDCGGELWWSSSSRSVRNHHARPPPGVISTQGAYPSPNRPEQQPHRMRSFS